MSAATIERKVGATAPPLVGPANRRLAFWLVSVIAQVPEVVMVQPAAVKNDGTVVLTLVTVPDPTSALHVPSPCSTADADPPEDGTHPEREDVKLLHSVVS